MVAFSVLLRIMELIIPAHFRMRLRKSVITLNISNKFNKSKTGALSTMVP